MLNKKSIFIENRQPKPISATRNQINDLSPNADLGVRTGDIINFSAHATPNSKVIVQFGEHELTLLPYKGKYANGNSPEVTYGKVVQSSPADNSAKYSDVYKGAYQVNENDHFADVHPQYTLVSGEQKSFCDKQSNNQTVEELITARTVKTPTVVRIAPDLARTTPLVEDVTANY